MTVLKKLQISGIRTFRPNPTDIEHQTITFDEPITVITGENGTGKTTIIEALKVAIKGGIKNCPEMISEPNIWSANEVQSQIVCQFESADQKLYTVKLSPVLTKTLNNARGEKLKTGECQVLIQKPDGTEESIEISTNDIENRIPAFFSASVPMIENVIFCHQDNSCWPIEDKDSELKSKFDQIFGAEKYNSAMKELKECEKKLQKQFTDLDASIREETARLEALKQIEANIEEGKSKMVSTEKELNHLESEWNYIDDCYRQYNQIKPQIDEINIEIANCEGQFQSEASSCEKKRESITDLKPLEECKSLRESIQLDLESKDEQRENDKRQLDQYLSNEMQLQQEIESIQNEHTEKSNLIKDHEAQHKLYSYQIQEFEKKYQSTDFQDILGSKERDLAEITNKKNDKKEEQKETLQKVDDEIDQLKSQKATEDAEVQSLSNQLKEFTKQLKNIGESSEEELHQKQIEIEKISKELEETIELKKNQNIESEIDQKQNELNKLEEELSQLSQEKQIADGYSENLKKLQKTEDTIRNSSAKIELCIQKVNRGLNRDDVEIENFKQIFKDEKLQAEDELQTIRNKEKNLEKEKAALSERYQTRLEYYQKQEKEYQKSVDNINSVMSPDDGDYYELVLGGEEAIRVETEELSKLSNSTIQDLYTDFKQKALDGHFCPLCERSFDNQSEFDDFIQQKIDNRISSIPDEIIERKNNKKQYEERYKQLKEIESDIKTRDLFLRHKQKLEDELDQSKNSLKKIETDSVVLQQNLTSAEQKLHSIMEVQSDIKLLEQSKFEYDNAVVQKQRIPPIDPAIRSVDQILSEMASIQKAQSDFNSQINKLNRQLTDYNEKIRKLDSEQNEMKPHIYILEQDCKKKAELDDKVNSIKNQIKEKCQMQKQIEGEIASKRLNRKEISDQFEIQNKQIDEQITEITNEYQICKTLVDSIEKLEIELKEFDIDKTSQQIKLLESDLNAKTTTLNQVRGYVSNLNSKMAACDEEHHSLSVQLRDLDKQAEYYSIFAKCQQLIKKKDLLIANRSKMLGKLNGQDFDELLNTHHEMSKKIESLNERKRNIEDSLTKSINDSKKYETTRKSLTKASLEYEATKMALSDLKRYVDKLDETLLEYHQSKMNEINEIIYRLWKNTYYGRDIDYIQIKCDTEKKRKNVYNYRVVMRKNNTDLDMAKRCSAGQRMLASIIIRLALAETFCSNCGIIALDEPTTNLDSRNMVNLAKALTELVSNRANPNSRPFQMIIITHNIEFTKLLLNEDAFENYYQITRTVEGTVIYSQINKYSHDFLE